MKLALVIVLLGAICGAAVAERILLSDTFDYQGEWKTNSGTWKTADGELLQLDDGETMAVISRMVRQRGILLYEFDLRYIGGLDDGYGGFGIHILLDSPTGVRSWGQNNSLLLWFAYDLDEYGTEHFYAQSYRSTGVTRMDYFGMKGNEYPISQSFLSAADLEITASTGEPLRIRFLLDTANGTGRLYNPHSPGSYLPLDLNSRLSDGMYIALRTNSLQVAFDNVTVTLMD